MNVSLLELVLVVIIAIALFTVLFKYLKWAIGAVIAFILVLLGLYLALRVLDYSDSSGAIVDLLKQIKDKLGLSDPQTQAEVNELTNDVIETTKLDNFIAKFNLKEIWNDIKAILSF
jgi:hypothetical protein